MPSARRCAESSSITHAHTRPPKRGYGETLLSFDEALVPAATASVDLLALDEALTRLAALDPQLGRIVELKFFGGLTLDEIAEVLHISAATVSRDCAMAKAWLYAALQD